jgi:hypothetical protein
MQNFYFSTILHDYIYDCKLDILTLLLEHLPNHNKNQLTIYIQDLTFM